MLHKYLLLVLVALLSIARADDTAISTTELHSTELETTDIIDIATTDLEDLAAYATTDETFSSTMDIGSSDDDESDDDDASSEDEEEEESADDADDEEDSDDECVGLTQEQCSEEIEEGGDPECSFNIETGECFSVVRRTGTYGSGSYDDGYVAAKDAAKQQSDQLYTIIGVLGGIIGALVIVIGGGGYYFYTKGKQDIMRETSEMMNADDPAMGNQTMEMHNRSNGELISGGDEEQAVIINQQ